MRKLAPLLVLLVSLTAFVQQPAPAAGVYRQPLWGPTYSSPEVDVFIVPPRHGQVLNEDGVLGGGDIVQEVNPMTTSYMRAIVNSVKDWERAIIAYGSTTLRTGLGCSATTKDCSKIKKYVIGKDVPPTGTRPEIVITTDENKGFILGVAISTRPCLVLNSSFFILSMTYEAMFGINAQEYGHCLGLGHVNETNNQAGEASLTHDPMNGLYADDPSASNSDLHCVSNLNVKGIEESFRDALGTGTGAGYGEITASSYTRPRYNAAAPTWGCIL